MRKPVKTSSPVLDGTVDVPPAGPTGKKALKVAVKADGPERRFRALLGPFTHEPREVEVAPWQAAALAADPWLDLT